MQHAAISRVKLAAGVLLAVFLMATSLTTVPAWASTSTPLASGNSTAITTQASVAVHYQAKVLGNGWLPEVSTNKIAGTTGQSLQMRGLSVTVDTGSYTGSVKYRVHTSAGKWSGWKKDGAKLATARRIDAVQIKLNGTIADKYDIVYRTHVQNVGWQRRVRNGETAGAPDSGLRVEAVRISLVSKKKRSGWISDDFGTWSFYRSGKQVASKWVVTDESPIDMTASGKHRYWIDSSGTLAVSRYIAPSQWTDSKAGWAAYATPAGYVATGKYANGEDLLLADENGKLYTKTRWLVTSKFDGTKQYYRLVKKGPIAVVKTGLFKVGNKNYYGWEDGRGYIMRSNYWWVGNGWYKANSKGVLSPYKGKTTKLINRYVNWAVKIAKDDAHGYSQLDRWGPDYDCSSLVCSALKAAGFPDSGATYTGNMKSCLTQIGFVWHKGGTKNTKNLRRGDIMLIHKEDGGQHTEIYLGNDKLVGAHSSETGGISGDTGDQTGNEISVTKYYNYPWQGYLRYEG